MPGRSCYFFADEEDLSNLLEAFKGLGDYKYVQMRSELNKSTGIYHDPSEVLSEAMVLPDRPIRAHSFLVLESGDEIFDEDIVLRDGSGVRKKVGQSQNWNSITLAFGGDAGDQTLIMSDIATIGDTDKAVEMHKKFKKMVMAKTKNVGVRGSPARLMPGAIEKFKAGWRLASDKGWSRDTDPQISPEAIAAL